MIRWFVVWRLRRAQSALQQEIDWLRETVAHGQVRLDQLENRERAVQAKLWGAQSAHSLLPRRADSGISSKG